MVRVGWRAIMVLAGAGALGVARAIGALPDPVHGLGLALELGFAGIGQRIDSLPCGRVRGDHPFVFQLLQGGIDCASAGFVYAARLGLQLLH